MHLDKKFNNKSWRFSEQEKKYVNEVLDSGFVASTSGSMNTRLENAFADKLKRNYAITFNSGTTTLHASLFALNVGYGDEVLVPALTVISCMNAIVYCNAIPVFVDIDKDTFLMDPRDIEAKITSKTKAILVVHLYGQICNMTEICRIAEKHKIPIIEDCAQCYLAKHNGKFEGSFGQVSSWSFENSKHITCGDGGIIATDNQELATKIRKLSTQGFRNASAKSGQVRAKKDLFQNPEYKRHDMFGFMYRLPEVAAAIALGQVEKLEYFISLRRKMGKMFKDVVNSYGKGILSYQKIQDGDESSYWSFAAKIEDERINWNKFREIFIKNGGDPIYAPWALLYQEDSVDEIKKLQSRMGLKAMITSPGICPISEKLQKRILQFTTNQHLEWQMLQQSDALIETLKYFK